MGAQQSPPVDPLHVSQLDPLHVDGRLPIIVAMNASSDVNGLLRLLGDLVPAPGVIAGLSLQGCLAVMRDLGLLLGSVKRHGAEPVNLIPGLEGTLRDVGTRTGMIPRDTVLHYAIWNPAGPRERTYTGDGMERLMISSLRLSLPSLMAAIERCSCLSRLDVVDPEFAVAADELATCMLPLEDAIGMVLANVTPEFFARTLRPYFEAVSVGGTDYLGPAAAHIPLYLVDLALWSNEYGHDPYREFWHESAQYGLPQWRGLAGQWSAGPSAIGRVRAALKLAGDGPVPPSLQAGAAALCRVLRTLVVFRGRHLRMARRAYEAEIRLFALGSGGGSVQLLKEITLLTSENAKSLAQSMPGTRAGVPLSIAAGGSVMAHEYGAHP